MTYLRYFHLFFVFQYTGRFSEVEIVFYSICVYLTYFFTPINFSYEELLRHTDDNGLIVFVTIPTSLSPGAHGLLPKYLSHVERRPFRPWPLITGVVQSLDLYVYLKPTCHILTLWRSPTSTHCPRQTSIFPHSAHPRTGLLFTTTFVNTTYNTHISRTF